MMFVKDDKNWIKIEFPRNEGYEYYSPEGYEEISLNFDLETVGWGSVSNIYFSHRAIREILEMLRLLLDNKIDELHYSDDSPKFKVKPFYWIDILRKEREYELHIKIHDCLEDYIELTEMVDASRIVNIKDEFEIMATAIPLALDGGLR